MVYLDDAESLQNPLGEGELAAWRDAEIASFWKHLTSTTTPGGSFAVIASCRYWVDGTDSKHHLALPPMPAGDTVKLLRWFPTLSRVPREDQDWLATEIVDGHPRTAEFLEELAARRERQLVGPQGQYQGGNWRADIFEEILPQTKEKVHADLLLPKLWEALDDQEREHLGRCSVLADPVPWPAITMLASSSGDDDGADSAESLTRAGLLSPAPMSAKASGGRPIDWSPITSKVFGMLTLRKLTMNLGLGSRSSFKNKATPSLLIGPSTTYWPQTKPTMRGHSLG